MPSVLHSCDMKACPCTVGSSSTERICSITCFAMRPSVRRRGAVRAGLSTLCAASRAAGHAGGGGRSGLRLLVQPIQLRPLTARLAPAWQPLQVWPALARPRPRRRRQLLQVAGSRFVIGFILGPWKGLRFAGTATGGQWVEEPQRGGTPVSKQIVQTAGVWGDKAAARRCTRRWVVP